MEAPPASGTLPISVIVPAYNRAGFVGTALASVAAQRPAVPTEVIVIDDGSVDSTAEIAAGLGARVIRHERNRGTAAARNSGVEAATQPWIALLDSDDEWLPHHLAELWPLRSGHVLVAGSALERSSRSRQRLHGPAEDQPLVLSSPAYLVYPGNVIPASAAIVRREVVRALGGFRPPNGVEDLDLWLRVLESGRGIVSPSATVIYNVHSEQASREVSDMEDGHLTVVKRFAGRPWWSEALVERWQGRTAWNHVRSAIRRGRPLEAFKEVAWIAARRDRAFGAVNAAVQRARRSRRATTVEKEPRGAVGRC
jgi:glycosyltransferase involved in cell wall biosynthesis